MTDFCVIPARGGSRRIPRKNIRFFHGKPIIAYSIQTAIDSKLFDRVIVSSDDPAILNTAEYYGAEAQERPACLADDVTGTQKVMKHVLDHASAWGFACCIYPCAPLLVLADLIAAKEILIARNFQYVVSVGYPPLHDCGAFYFGRALAFRTEAPLFDTETGLYHLPANRDCDINTESDWQRALDLYVKAEHDQTD